MVIDFRTREYTVLKQAVFKNSVLKDCLLAARTRRYEYISYKYCLLCVRVSREQFAKILGFS